LDTIANDEKVSVIGTGSSMMFKALDGKCVSNQINTEMTVYNIAQVNSQPVTDMITGVFITTERDYPIEIDREFFDEVLIKTECPNILTRYLTAERAQNDIIYVQDDDVITDHKKLYQSYDGTLTNAITEHHLNFYKDSGITLVGWGCFFPKKMLEAIGTYIEKFGIDDVHLSRETDRIFTYLNQPHNSIVLPHEDVNQVRRMSHDPMHYQYIEEVLKKLKTIK
jgi:hypothetical protein